jgi:multidrug resistance efflux pump
MSNAFDDVRAAVSAAKFQLQAADSVATNMAALLMGRLRKVQSDAALAALKRELADYNIQTGKWKPLGKDRA